MRKKALPDEKSYIGSCAGAKRTLQLREYYFEIINKLVCEQNASASICSNVELKLKYNNTKL